MKKISIGIAVIVLIACLVLLVSTMFTCIIYPMDILHIIVVLSFVIAFVTWLSSWAIDWLLYLITKRGFDR